jgi:hypothetical protein
MDDMIQDTIETTADEIVTEPVAGGKKPNFLFNTDKTMRQYILQMGLVSLIPSIIFLFLLSATGIINESTAPDFTGPPVMLYISMVLIGPVIETLIMSFSIWCLAFITSKKYILALLNAGVWAILHSLLAPARGLGVFWPFFGFSCAYLAWREKGWWRAIWVTACIHAFQNAIPGLAVFFQ